MDNLSSRTSWQDLKDYMRQAGDIMYTNTHDRRSGEVSRFSLYIDFLFVFVLYLLFMGTIVTFQGIVEFGSRSDMEWALDKLDGSELDGRKIRLMEEGKRSRSR